MPSSAPRSFGQRLRHERERRNWSQEHLAEAVGTTARSIHRWEQEKTIPHPYYREQLCLALHVSADALFGTVAHEDHEDLAPLPLWHVPSRRNPLFTGREELLQLLHDALHTHSTAALPQSAAISGLGGIGKTQTAIEYAYRYRDHYQAVLWARAETPDILRADVAALAAALHLPEQGQQNQQVELEAVKRWLTRQTNWLLVLDNAEELNTVSQLLPLAPGGHILLTTRSPVTGTLVQGIELEPLGAEDGALLLLRRAKRLALWALLEEASATERTLALELAQALGGLPLALDQAGAYLEETACTLLDYHALYQTHRTALLELRGEETTDHPASVATTLSLCIEQVERVSPAARDLLCLCACLYPDAIPEEIMTAESDELGPVLGPVAADPLVFNLAIKELRRFSLLRRHPQTKELSVHRLVQAVMQDRLEPEQQRLWANRAIQMMSAFFSNKPYYLPQRWALSLPQLQWAAQMIDRWELSTSQAYHMLLLLAHALFWRGEAKQAELICTQLETLSLRRGYMRLFDAMGLWSFEAEVAIEQGRYQKAEELARRAARWCEQLLGSNHLETVESYEDLALILYYQGRYAEAEGLAEEMLPLKRQLLEPDDPRIASSLNGLGIIYTQQERYSLAEALLQQAIHIIEKRCGVEHNGPGLALFVANLADVYCAIGQYPEAEARYGRALAMREHLGLAQHVHQALTLVDLASCYSSQGRYAEAARVTQQALPILRQSLRPDHPWMAFGLNEQATILAAQGEEGEAEILYEQALHLLSQALGREHKYVAKTLTNMAELARMRRCYGLAASYYQQALEIQKRIVGDDGPSVRHISERYQAVLQAMDQAQEDESRG